MGSEPATVEEVVDAPARPEALDAVHAALARFWAAGGSPPDDWRFRFETAVAEVATNVIRHSGAPHMRLSLRRHVDRIEAELVDRGVEYVEPAPRPEPDPLDLPEGGFGLAIARAAVDRLEYRRSADGQNHWLLTKQLASRV